MVSFIYKWLPIVFGCHQMERRSFHFKGKAFPICARCTGELAGIILAAVTLPFFSIGAVWSVIFMIPLIADGFVQSLTKYESTNTRRFITGVLFGIGLTTLFVLSSAYAFETGKNLALKIK